MEGVPDADDAVRGIAAPEDAGVDVVVPLKRLDQAKSRLLGASAAVPGEPEEHARAHRALVLALAHDTLAAVRDAGPVRRVVLVTAEEGLDLGVAAERVADPGDGLNAALRAGAAHLRATGTAGAPAAVAVLQADLPALRAVELDAALRAALVRVRHAPAAFVADRHGSGTTMLVTRPGHVPDPRFGPGSADAHRAGGALALDGPWPGLRADVDTPEDLLRVRDLGCGPATSAWLRRTRAAWAAGPVRANGSRPRDGCAANPR